MLATQRKTPVEAHPAAQGAGRARGRRRPFLSCEIWTAATGALVIHTAVYLGALHLLPAATPAFVPQREPATRPSRLSVTLVPPPAVKPPELLRSPVPRAPVLPPAASTSRSQKKPPLSEPPPAASRPESASPVAARPPNEGDSPPQGGTTLVSPLGGATRVGPAPSRGLARLLPSAQSSLVQAERNRGAVVSNLDTAVRLEARFHAQTRAFLFRSRFLESENVTWANLLLQSLEKHFNVPESAFKSLSSALFVYDITASGQGCEAKLRRLVSSRIESFDTAIDALVSTAARAAGPLLDPVRCAGAEGNAKPRITFALSILLTEDPSSSSFAKLLGEVIEVERGEGDRGLEFRLNVLPLLLKLFE